MALCLKRRSACWTSLDRGCCNWTTLISILTLTTGLLFLVAWICSLKENQKSPLESAEAPRTTREIRLCEIDQQSSGLVRSAGEMPSDDDYRGQVQGSGLLSKQSPRISKADSKSNRDVPARLKADRADLLSVDYMERLRYIFYAVPKKAANSTHTKNKRSMFVGVKSTIRHLMKQRHKATLFHRRKLRPEGLSYLRKVLLLLDKRTNLGQPSVSKANKINRPTNKLSTCRLCCFHSYPMRQATYAETKRREHRRKRRATVEDREKLKKFLIRLIESTMSTEERTARNLTDSRLDSLLTEEVESRSNANDSNTNQTGIRKNETLLMNNTLGNTTGRNQTGGKHSGAEVGESVLGGGGGEGVGPFQSGEFGGAGDGKLIISAQILNGSESKELGQIVVNSKNRMEVAIKLTNTSGNASTEQKQWIVELNGEQKMFVAAVIAIASIVAVGTLVFACVWCLYDHEGLCMGVFPCIKPPKDNFSPQRWWMETLARRVENLESQPILATEKHKRTSISTKYQANKDEGRLSQMVSRLSERMSKTGHNMSKKEQMARNSQMARASQEARNSQMENDSNIARDVKVTKESVQKSDSQLNKSNNQQKRM